MSAQALVAATRATVPASCSGDSAALISDCANAATATAATAAAAEQPNRASTVSAQPTISPRVDASSGDPDFPSAAYIRPLKGTDASCLPKGLLGRVVTRTALFKAAVSAVNNAAAAAAKAVAEGRRAEARAHAKQAQMQAAHAALWAWQAKMASAKAHAAAQRQEGSIDELVPAQQRAAALSAFARSNRKTAARIAKAAAHVRKLAVE